MVYQLLKINKRYIIVSKDNFGHSKGYERKYGKDYWWSLTGYYTYNIHRYISKRKAISHLKRLAMDAELIMEIEK